MTVESIRHRNRLQCPVGSPQHPESDAMHECGALSFNLETLRAIRIDVEDRVYNLGLAQQTEGWPIMDQYVGRKIKNELDEAERELAVVVNNYVALVEQGRDSAGAYEKVSRVKATYADLMNEILSARPPPSAPLCAGQGVTKFYVPSTLRKYHVDLSGVRQGLDETLRCEQILNVGGKVYTLPQFEAAGGELCESGEADLTRLPDGKERALAADFWTNDRFSPQRRCAKPYDRSSIPATTTVPAPPPPPPVGNTNPVTAAPVAPPAPTLGQQVQTWKAGLSQKGRAEGAAEALALMYTDVMLHQMKNGASAPFDYSLRIAERWKQAETRQMTGLKLGLLELYNLNDSDAALFKRVLQNARTYFKDEGIEGHLAKYRQRAMQGNAPAPAPTPTPPSAPVRPPIQIRDLQFEAVDTGPFTPDEFKALRELVKAGWETDLRAYITAMYCSPGKGRRIAEFTSTDGQFEEQMCAAPMTQFYGSILNPESIIQGRRGSLLSESKYLIEQLGIDKVYELEDMVKGELMGKPGRPGAVYQQWVDQAMKVVVHEASPEGLRRWRQHTVDGNPMTTMKNYWAAHKLDFAKAVLLNVLSLPPGSSQRKAAVNELGQMLYIWFTPR